MIKRNLGKHLPGLSLLAVAMIWGGGFMATQMTLDNGLLPEHMLAGRFLLAAPVMLIPLRGRLFPISRRELFYGAVTGFLLFAGFYAQVLGLRVTTPSNNGFFTSCNVIMVPLIAWVLHRKRPPVRVFTCSIVALAGFFVLSYRSDIGFSVNTGDLLTLLCAFFFACHIAAVGLFAPRTDVTRLNFLQLAFAGLFSLAAFLTTEPAAVLKLDFAACVPPVLYLSLLSTCLAFFVQVWAQVRMNSGKAAVILSGEALWCAVFSVMMGYEPLTWQMLVGGFVVVGAVCFLEAGDFPKLRGLLERVLTGKKNAVAKP